MKKNGFTLIEMMAVIAIIAVLTILLLPDVIDTFTETKDSNFITETRELCRTATNTYIRESVITMESKDYYKFNSDTTHALPLTGRSEFNYYVKVNTDGAVVAMLVWDDNHVIKIVDSEGIQPKSITEQDFVENVDVTSMNVIKANTILSN